MDGAPHLKLFISYDSGDAKLWKELHAHFSSLKRQGVISVWEPSSITGGQESKKEIEKHFQAADIILLLISAQAMSSDDWYMMMTQAIERQRRDDVKVIPIRLKAVDIEGTPLSTLEMLPKGGEPVTDWDDHDKAYEHITQEIKKVIDVKLGLHTAFKDAQEKQQREQDNRGHCPYRGIQPYSEEKNNRSGYKKKRRYDNRLQRPDISQRKRFSFKSRNLVSCARVSY